jgi:hypothetical protein
MITIENRDSALDLLTSEQLDTIANTDKEYCMLELCCTNTMAWIDLETTNDLDDINDGAWAIETQELIELIEELELVENNERERVLMQRLTDSLI